jgi:hypothetical protein
MDREWEYISLSKRFESFAERSADPKLAAAYRSLAEHYRTLDRWRQKVTNRYEAAASEQPEATAPENAEHPPRQPKPS